MAVLRVVRHGGGWLIRSVLPAWLCCACLLAVAACERPDPELLPDEVLQSELGLDIDDRVHTIRIRTGVAERATPSAVVIRPGDYVQFVSDDGMVHEIGFALDSVTPPQRVFLDRTGQSSSTPLLERGARFVVSFVGAPEGRYPFILAGGRDPGEGEIVVERPPD